MFENYLKTALRSMWKQKFLSLLNILGLSVGIASALLIFLWVEDELTFNHPFPNRSRLYQVFTDQTYSDKTYTFPATPGPLAPAMKQEIPGVALSCRATWDKMQLLGHGDKSLNSSGIFADSAFWTLFGIRFLEGNAQSAFSLKNNIVLTRRCARKLFGDQPAIGRQLTLDNQDLFSISGVIEDFPENSDLRGLEWISPFEAFLTKNPWLQEWGSNGLRTYVLLDEHANKAQIDQKLFGFIKSKNKEAIANPILLAADDWHLRNRFEDGKQAGGRIRIVRLFAAIAWIILLLACINFMNLATARSERRSREVGIRKVLGSSRSRLVGQFITEALLTTLISLLAAQLLVRLCLPAFNGLVGKDLGMRLGQPIHLAALLVILFVCGLLAGSYPAFFLSSLNPIGILKKINDPGGAGRRIRQGLVVSQFAISVTLIVCTLVIYQQVNYAKDRELGIQRAGLISLSQEMLGQSSSQGAASRFQVLKNALQSTGVVENLCLSNNTPFQVGSNSSDFDWPGKDPGKPLLISMEWVSPEFLSTMGMQLLAGRDFYPDGLSDSLNLVVNASFARLIARDPGTVVGKRVGRGDQKFTIIGVIRDYVYNNVYGPVAPLVVFSDPKAENTAALTLRIRPGVGMGEALAKIQEVFRKISPAYPFEYQFVDKQYERLFQGENLIGTLAACFAGLAIFISCLGLFGLAAFMAERRIKELGIRKVLGATLQNLVGLLSKDFMILVGLSFLFAFPLAGWMMHRWLQEYPYRVHLNAWMFVVPGLLAIGISLLTVSFQALRAARSSPVKTLRAE